MPKDHTDAPAMPLTLPAPVPTRGEIIGASAIGNPRLAERLDIREPGDLQNVPPTLAFDRVREVSLPWPQLIERMAQFGDGGMPRSPALKHFFETSWWGSVAGTPDQAALDALTEAGLVVTLPALDAEGNPTGQAFFDQSGEPVTAGVVLRDAMSGRHYLMDAPLPEDGAAPFASPDNYRAFWEGVTGAAIVATDAEAAKAGRTRYEELDLRAIFIERRFKELDKLAEIIDATSTKAEGSLDAMLDKAFGPDLNFEAAEAIQARYVSARLGPFRIARQKRQLKKQAADMGYVLFIGEASESPEDLPGGKLDDGSEIVVTEGALYRQFTRKCEYTVDVPLPAIQVAGNAISWAFGKVFGGGPSKVRTTRKEARSKLVKDYARVDTLTDPLQKKVNEYRHAGKEVHVFEEAPSGYRTADGVALDTVMAQCTYDEEIRQNCVVMLPIYEQAFAVERPIVAYHIFEGPLPGLTPTRLPRLFLKESLTYRTAWKGAELGELVSTVTLAPGEEREISMTRTYERETSTTETRSSISELTSAESSDLATEMEKVARTENEFKAHADSSSKGSVGGPLGGAITGSFESSVSFGASDTLKTFSESMNKVAKKAASSINRKTQQEVSTTSTQKTRVSTTDSTTIKMSNINQGRTLNLTFNRIYNRFEAGLFVEDLQFGVQSAVELIAGSGIYGSQTFRLDRVDQMVEMLREVPLPFDATSDAITDFLHSVLDVSMALVDVEYAHVEEEGPDTFGLGAPAADSPSAGAFLAPPAMREAAGEARDRVKALTTASSGRRKAATLDEASLNARCEEFAGLYRKLQARNLALGGERQGISDLLVAAPGLYMDSIVGARAATEPYSEEMRAQEIRTRAADVLKAEAEARYSMAQAERISAAAGLSPSGGNRITGVHAEAKGRSLTLGLALPLPKGDWVVCVDGAPAKGGEIPAELQLRTAMTFAVPRVPANQRGKDWITYPDLMSRLTLLNRDTDDIVAGA